MLGTLPITTERSEGLLPEIIFFLVYLLRVGNLEFKNEFHLRISLAKKACEFSCLIKILITMKKSSWRNKEIIKHIFKEEINFNF